MVFITSLFVLTHILATSVVGQLECIDLDPQGCMDMAKHNPDMCSDAVLSRSVCPQYCQRCSSTSLPIVTATTRPTTVVLTTPVCEDEPWCHTISETFCSAGEDVCNHATMKYACNKTCSLCPGIPTSSSQFDICSVIRCQHGSCSVLPSGHFHCQCNQGFEGIMCDRKIPVQHCRDLTPQSTCKLASAIVCSDVDHARNANCMHYCGFC